MIWVYFNCTIMKTTRINGVVLPEEKQVLFDYMERKGSMDKQSLS